MKNTEDILGETFNKLMNDFPEADCIQKVQSLAYCLSQFIFYSDELSLDDRETKAKINDVFMVIDAFCASALAMSEKKQMGKAA